MGITDKLIIRIMRRVNNHGHVVKRKDGRLARCDGPAGCRTCREDKRAVDTAIEQAIQSGESIQLWHKLPNRAVTSVPKVGSV